MISKERILCAVLHTPMPGGGVGLPTVFWGEPGTAKSSIVESTAARLGLRALTLSPATVGEAAFGVIPVPVQVNGKTVLSYPAPDFVDWLGDEGVLFLDDLSAANEHTQRPLLGLLTARQIGFSTLPPGVRIVAAANPEQLAPGGAPLAASLANRLAHLPWAPPTFAEHRAYALGRAQNLAPLTSKPVEVDAALVGLELAFLSAQPHWKNVLPALNDPARHRAWPSDRMWDWAVRAWSAGKAYDLSEEECFVLVAGCIGQPAAEAWWAFCERVELPDLAAVLDGMAFEHDKVRLDRTIAALDACVRIVGETAGPSQLGRAERLWEILGEVAGYAMDLAVAPAKDLAALGLPLPKPVKKSAYYRLLVKIAPMASP